MLQIFIRQMLITLFCILIANSCSNKNIGNKDKLVSVKPYPHTINISEGLKNNTELKLTDIADSIRYVVLSKNKEAVIGSFRRLQMAGDDIYINAGGLIMRFDMSGKFLNSIGSRGRGPEEYLPGSPYAVTMDNEEVVISKGVVADYLSFKPDGEFIGSKELPWSRNMFDFVFVSDSSLLLTFYFVGSFMNRDYLNSMPWLAGLFNFNGKLMGVLKNPLDNVTISESDMKRVILTNPFFTHFDNRIVLSPEGDTIYEIDQNSMFPGFILDWGPISHDQTPEELYYRQSEPSNRASVSGFFLETTTKAYCRLSSGGDNYILQYDKVTQATRSMKEDRNNPGFINDLDGGANFFPYWTNREGDIWIVYDDAFSFKNKHSDELLINSSVINSENKVRLRSFLQNLKPDDNPVLKIVYLKR